MDTPLPQPTRVRQSSDRCLGNVRPHLFSSLQCFNPHHLLLLLGYDSTEMTSYLRPKYHINCSFKQSLHFRSKLVHPPPWAPISRLGYTLKQQFAEITKLLLFFAEWVWVCVTEDERSIRGEVRADPIGV